MIDFDRQYDRRNSDANKWRRCRPGEIPMWIADMDFAVPSPILDALCQRLEHPFFGYDITPQEALKTASWHYKDKYGYEVPQEWLVPVLSVMPGLNVGVMEAGGALMYCTPMYSHIRKLGEEAGVPVVEVPLQLKNGRYTFDFDAMEHAVTPNVKSFVLCNPHNPVGRIFNKQELLDLVEFCHRHGLILLADEIHGEFALDAPHIPLFTLGMQALKNTVTVTSAGKICNIPRLPMGFAVIPDEDLRKRYVVRTHHLFGRGCTLSAIAFQKAFDGSCDIWKEELRSYLRANRAYMEQRIADMPGISVHHSEGTYLAWINCSALEIDCPQRFFREEAGVFMNDGADFGDPHFVRINFACPRRQLEQALDRMELALQKRVRI